jgi:hypothetical protein
MNATRCPRCNGILLIDSDTDELVCFECSRRFQLDGSTTEKAIELPARGHERIAGMRF